MWEIIIGSAGIASLISILGEFCIKKYFKKRSDDKLEKFIAAQTVYNIGQLIIQCYTLFSNHTAALSTRNDGEYGSWIGKFESELPKLDAYAIDLKHLEIEYSIRYFELISTINVESISLSTLFEVDPDYGIDEYPKLISQIALQAWNLRKDMINHYSFQQDNSSWYFIKEFSPQTIETKP